MSANLAPLPDALEEGNSPAIESSPAVGVTKCASRWTVQSTPAEAEALARTASLPLTIAALLYARGIRSPKEAESFLSPRLDALHDPYSMRGMQFAVNRFSRRLKGKKRF